MTVHADNDVAIRLFEKMAFRMEGRERKATYRNGSYVDILIMGRIRD